MSCCAPAEPGVPLRFFLTAAVVLTALGCGSSASAAPSQRQALRFAAEMAERGSWREADYRWRQVAERGQPDAHLLNNLAVSAEALGDMDRAAELYDRALKLSEGDPRIVANHRRFFRLREHLEESSASSSGDADEDESAAAAEAAPPEPSWAGGAGKETGGKPLQVEVGIPIPPRLKLDGVKSVLVASFLENDSVLIEVSRELVRFLRGELRKRTDLDVLDVVPPPAIPEQRPDDLVANAEFWKHLGREYGADLILSGVVDYTRRDASGFEDVDVVSERTGQKVRQTQFVEQEEFSYVLDVFFIDGATGTLLYRDRMRRNVLYRGAMNDPIHAFYDLSGSIGDDVLAVVTTRTRIETRTIFRR